MLTSKLLKQFNHPDTILVLSKYPWGDLGHSHHGVATYTQHVLEEISTQTKQRFVVLVQHEYGRTPQVLANGKILILPCFDDSLHMFGQLWQTISAFTKIKLLHVHSEFYTSGKIMQMGLTIPFLAGLRLLGKKVMYIAHNVVTDFTFMARHLGKKQTDPILKLSEKLLPLYYAFLGAAVDNVVVLDESVRRKITQFISGRKVTLSPHWIHPQAVSTGLRRKWRQHYGFAKEDQVLVCFGFMTRYKGVDWLVDTITKLRRKSEWRNLHLILAGGAAPSQIEKKHYRQFYQELEQKVANTNGVTLTGFVPEADLSGHFALADLVVLPYRGILGASGSWAQALAHGKPFILSTDLESYLKNEEVQTLLDTHQLTPNDLLFTRHLGKFESFLKSTLIKSRLTRIKRLSGELAQLRSPQVRIPIEMQSLYSLDESSTFSLQFLRNLARIGQALILVMASFVVKVK